jgi:hypothetical protein
MLSEREITEALKLPKPATFWKAEPLLGGHLRRGRGPGRRERHP